MAHTQIAAARTPARTLARTWPVALLLIFHQQIQIVTNFFPSLSQAGVEKKL